MATMARYLGERVCREFARDHAITCTCLRLGTLVRADQVSKQTPDHSWLDPRDAARAFRCALKRDRAGSTHWINRWKIIHVCADFDNPRFLIDAAQGMGFRPEHGFEV
jgi:nucleoside-diphosphate-sugar epimerase